MRTGFLYASARRDPRETDSIAPLAVLMTSANTFYDPISHVMRLNPFHAVDDFSVLHEYAHYLEERISSFQGIAARHDGCVALVGNVDVMERGYAWMEGFADYFAMAVQRALPGDVSGDARGTLGGLEIPSCPGVSKPRIELERFVASALFDLVDGPDTFEPADNYCSIGVATDKLIFQIFDRELDIGFTNPTLQLFADAWATRGLDLPLLQETFGQHGVAITVPAPTPRYDTSPAANVAVVRPESSGSIWFIRGAAISTRWGLPGDVPVPADYDGDGLTDVAIWRPSDGTWWVVHSSTNQTEVVQWGQPFDRPVPADYDGDGEADFAVYRPGGGQVWIRPDGCGNPFNVVDIGFGEPFVGDFDGDGREEFGTLATTGQIRIRLATGATLASSIPTPTVATPVPRDYDGDGKTDLAVFTPGDARWYIRKSASGGALTNRTFGTPGFVVPVPADYDGDGTIDLATWRTTDGIWTIQPPPRQPVITQQWGQSGDTPVPAP